MTVTYTVYDNANNALETFCGPLRLATNILNGMPADWTIEEFAGGISRGIVSSQFILLDAILVKATIARQELADLKWDIDRLSFGMVPVERNQVTLADDSGSYCYTIIGQTISRNCFGAPSKALEFSDPGHPKMWSVAPQVA